MEVHPARRAGGPHVLIISDDADVRAVLEQSIPPSIPFRSIHAACETEGLGAKVVVIGSDFPLVELNEVRVHPQLFDLPVVLFAPAKELPAMDWPSLGVAAVCDEHNAIDQLVWHVRRLLHASGWRARSARPVQTLELFTP